MKDIQERISALEKELADLKKEVQEADGMDITEGWYLEVKEGHQAVHLKRTINGVRRYVAKIDEGGLTAIGWAGRVLKDIAHDSDGRIRVVQ